MLKKKLLQTVRKLKLMQDFDKINYWLHKIKNDKRNKKFIRENPQVALPPAYTLYEAYRIDYNSYYHDGKNIAEWLVKDFFSLIASENKTILDWGCGPARVVRHLPDMLPGAEIHGSDYNKETIEWCRQNIHGIQFSVNALQPPMDYSSDEFDAVYALSVFTHLSELNHHSWINELNRIIKPGGYLLITTQGEAFLGKLSGKEITDFKKGLLIVRDKVKEGHRTFSAFHPENFMKTFFSANWKIVKLIKGKVEDWGPEQDTWIVQKIK